MGFQMGRNPYRCKKSDDLKFLDVKVITSGELGESSVVSDVLSVRYAITE